jgi:hypothetical protein
VLEQTAFQSIYYVIFFPSQTKSFLHLQDVLQEDAVNAEDRNSCQSVSEEKRTEK